MLPTAAPAAECGPATSGCSAAITGRELNCYSGHNALKPIKPIVNSRTTLAMMARRVASSSQLPVILGLALALQLLRATDGGGSPCPMKNDDAAAVRSSKQLWPGQPWGFYTNYQDPTNNVTNDMLTDAMSTPAGRARIEVQLVGIRAPEFGRRKWVLKVRNWPSVWFSWKRYGVVSVRAPH